MTTIAYLTADSNTSGLQNTMTAAEAAAFSSPDAIARNARLKYIPGAITDLEGDLEERKKGVVSAQAVLDGMAQYKNLQSLGNDPRNDLLRRTIEFHIAPQLDKLRTAQGLVDKDEKLIESLKGEQERLSGVQSSLATKYEEATKAYDQNVKDVKDLSKTLDQLSSSLKLELGIFGTASRANEQGSAQNDTVSQLSKTSLGRALAGAQAIAANLYAGRPVSSQSINSLISLESNIARSPVDLGTAMGMASAAAASPSAYLNQFRNLDTSFNALHQNPALRQSASNLDAVLQTLVEQGTASKPLYTRAIIEGVDD